MQYGGLKKYVKYLEFGLKYRHYGVLEIGHHVIFAVGLNLLTFSDLIQNRYLRVYAESNIKKFFLEDSEIKYIKSNVSTIYADFLFENFQDRLVI